MTEIIVAFIALIGSAVGSGLIQFFAQRNDNSSKLLLGLAHTEIIRQGEEFKRRGSISYEELDDYWTYLCKPYFDRGGNGSGKQMWDEVKALPKVVTRSA